MSTTLVRSRREPSDAAWRRSGDVAARILENLAQREARAAATILPRVVSDREAQRLAVAS